MVGFPPEPGAIAFVSWMFLKSTWFIVCPVLVGAMAAIGAAEFEIHYRSTRDWVLRQLPSLPSQQLILKHLRVAWKLATRRRPEFWVRGPLLCWRDGTILRRTVDPLDPTAVRYIRCIK